MSSSCRVFLNPVTRSVTPAYDVCEVRMHRAFFRAKKEGFEVYYTGLGTKTLKLLVM
jgi:hypothetical protein